jgi:hypothetical protein
MSDLIDRYAMAVSANLPKDDRDDITAELRDILYSKVEAREAELGRPLNRAEEEALLRDFGHPLEVAGRYGKNQYLIGPETYPFYIFFLKAVMGILIAIFLGMFALSVVVEGYEKGGDQDVLEALFIAFAAVTLTFVVFDRTGVIKKIAAKWKPSELPLLGAPHSRSTFEVLFEIAIDVAVALWWVGAYRLPAPAVPDHIGLSLAPVWETLFWPILALLIGQIGLNVFELVAPGLARAHAWARIVFHLVMVGVLAVLWQADHWISVSVQAGVGRPDLAERLQSGFDNGFRIGLAFAVLCVVYELWRTGRRLVRFNRLHQAKMA